MTFEIITTVVLFCIGYGIGHIVTNSKYGKQYLIYRRAGFTVLNSLKRAWKVWK
jgi:hypothetical protein